MAANLRLTLRYRRSCTRSEILAVGVSDGASPAAYALYPMARTSQSWIDIFDLNTQRGRSMMSGTHALFDPRGDRVATLRDSTVKLNGGVEYHYSSNVVIRDVATGKVIMELKEAQAQPLAWSRDGTWLAASENSNRVGVWDVRSGKRVGRVLSHIDTVTHADFTPKNDLVTASRDGTTRVTSLATGKTISRLEVGSGTVGNPQVFTLTSSGSTVASVWGTTMQIWLPQASHITSYSLGSVRATEGWPLCISADGQYMACRTEEGFDIMDVVSGRLLWEHKTDEPVTAGAFSPDCKVLVLGTIEGSIEVWDLAREAETRKE